MDVICNSPRREKINAATRKISRFATKNINLFLLKYYEERIKKIRSVYVDPVATLSPFNYIKVT